ncbi:bifunctional NUDIX hydrolase/phosphatase PAP2 family protein [Pseudomonas arsenicoxydans]|uniref:undecaprenyl-diphosphate phosphatase n=1 Tax=Pseudomonas arsenicoxydans TaxID=702115 RepID=A0A502HXT0_9PSED|nr:phosphatase PAP2 family protein [Pseudomonas arsenicoxydans]TPG79609.1 phosphatase PAP2 family protein [Pseudomonas arsenicoxydans]
MRKISLTSVLFILSILLFHDIAQATVLSNKPAGCVISSQDRILLVQGGPGNKWSLPAGYAEEGETPEQTAQRETLEETGLKVNIVGPIDIGEQKIQLFICRTEQPLQVSANRVNILNAPHLGRETIQAGLFHATEIEALKLRFPEQVRRLLEFSDAWQNSLTEEVDYFSDGLPHVQALELIWMNKLATKTSEWGVFFRAGNFLGETWFYVLCLPLIVCLFGWRYLHRMLLGLMLVTLLTQILKPMVAMARPFNYLPHLSLDGASGFGMPSGHAFSAMFFFGALALWSTSRIPLRYGALIALTLALWTAAARVWLGVHFASDVLAGIGLGFALLYLERLQSKYERSTGGQIAVQPSTWFSLGALSLIFGFIFSQESLLLPFAIAIGYGLAGSHSTTGKATAATSLWMLIGMSGLVLIKGYLTNKLSVFWQIAAKDAVIYLLLGYWLRAGAYRTFQRMFKSRLPILPKNNV